MKVVTLWANGCYG